MVMRVSLNGSDLKDLFRGKVIYKDMRTGPLEISLNENIDFSDMRDCLEIAIDEESSSVRRMKS
jgi:hypothetical protein